MRKVLTAEHRENIGLALRGRKFSEEHRRKMGLAQIGEKNHQWKGGKAKFVCLTCQTEFYRRASEIKGNAFCSTKCAYQYRTKLPLERKCEYCGEIFRPKKKGQKFCSMVCGGKNHGVPWIIGKKQTKEHIDKRVKRLDETYNWKGGIKTQNGYRSVRQSVGLYRREHRIIAEKALGRPLKEKEEVHHINGDPSDNRNCNLLICDTSYHRWLHCLMSRLYMKEHFSPKPKDYVLGASQISESVSENV